jgi:hypothetical protein
MPRIKRVGRSQFALFLTSVDNGSMTTPYLITEIVGVASWFGLKMVWVTIVLVIGGFFANLQSASQALAGLAKDY